MLVNQVSCESEMMKILSINDVKPDIAEMVQQIGKGDEVVYFTDLSHVKAVMMGAASYEVLLQRVARLETGLNQVWAAIIAPAEDEVVRLPTPDGGVRDFRLNRSITYETRAALQHAAMLAEKQADWTPEQRVGQGRQALDRARAEAIANGIAIDDEREAAIDD